MRVTSFSSQCQTDLNTRKFSRDIPRLSFACFQGSDLTHLIYILCNLYVYYTIVIKFAEINWIIIIHSKTQYFSHKITLAMRFFIFIFFI